MKRGRKSSKRDRQLGSSRRRDIAPRLTARLKAARREHQLSQRELAEKLGLRQRQISDLERGATDSRLTTVQNIARALDLELTLIPRRLIPAVEALQRAGTDPAHRPLYSLDDERGSDDSAEPPTRVEVGDTSDTHGTDAPPRRPPKRRSR
jgi:transcriptional regulator with XRE-family HTH domain